MIMNLLELYGTNIEIQAIKKAIRENKSLRMHKRYMVILHHLKGYLTITK